MEHYIYIIKANNWIYEGKQIVKIGSTKNIDTRMKNLATGNPFELKLVNLYHILNYNCYKLDNIIKIQLKKYNIKMNGGTEFYVMFEINELDDLFFNLNINFEKNEDFINKISTDSVIDEKKFIEDIIETSKIKQYEQIINELKKNNINDNTLIEIINKTNFNISCKELKNNLDEIVSNLYVNNNCDKLEKSERQNNNSIICDDIKIYIYYDIVSKEPYFHANQLTKSLGYVDCRDALNRHVEKKDNIYLKNITKDYKKLYKNVQGNTIFVNKTGMFSLILKSKKGKGKEISKLIIEQISKLGDIPGILDNWA